MKFNPKNWLTDYFKKKKPLGIFFDALFIILFLLLLFPATRMTVSSFLIRMTSFPPSTLDSDEQFVLNSETMNWQLVDKSGMTVSFEKLSEKPVFLNIWATWCPPCVAEIPGIVELYDRYQGEVNFVLLSNEDPSIVQKFAEKHGYTDLPFYYARYVPSDFESQSIPTTFVIDRNARVLISKKGAARWNSGKTEKVLEQLIAE